MEHGVLVVSLDFELIWGMVDKIYDKNVLKKVNNVKLVVPKILDLFKTYEIHATWAIVGLIMSENKEEIIKHINNLDISYENKSLDLTNVISHLNQLDQSIFCNLDLVKSILHTPHQEIASHSFSHFYALEKGQSEKDFIHDINIFENILNNKLNLKASTYIDPRFQHKVSYERYLLDQGYDTYRGIREDKIENKKLPNIFKRWIKFCDRYFNFLGHRTYTIENYHKLLNVKESYFFRGYKNNHFGLEWLKMIRFKKAMHYAAKHNEMIHIWWHPFDFGLKVDKNINQLQHLLKYYIKIKKRYQMKSYNMNEMNKHLKNKFN